MNDEARRAGSDYRSFGPHIFFASRSTTFRSWLLNSGPTGLTILSAAELLAIFGELDAPEVVKSNVRAIRQIRDQAGRWDYTVKVYPNAPVPHATT